ncbi:MAG: hypothetical protein D6713_00345 [Deltaproteobacteria bacterium]|nr:MAG: hypothetical protein D6713_00345 [Deltaproteobacteria bacterium]
MSHPSLVTELQALFDLFVEELHGIWIYFFLGVFIGAVIRTYRLHVRMRNQLAKFGAFAIPVAVLVGAFSPLCSCGSIPLFVSLVSSGVPLAPALALLITSPLMSPSGYTITAWELGVGWANVKFASAIFMGLFAGYLTHYLELRGFFGKTPLLKAEGPIDIHAPDCPGELRCTCGQQFSNRLARKIDNKFVIFLAKSWELTLKTGKFTLLGIAIAVLAERYIPREWIGGYLSTGSVTNTLFVTFFSAPLHVNEITAAAILYSLLNLGLAKGPGLAFLVGGPVTSIPAMSVLFTMCRRRVLGVYVFVSFVGTILLALVYQAVAG